jgi:molybdopterin converting factor small subunit
LKVRFYGKLADLLGNEREVSIDSPCTVADVRVRLGIDHPEAAESLGNRRVKACVGDMIVHDGHVLSSGETLELLAPVSGG